MSGEIIQLSDTMSLIFEVMDLAVASVGDMGSSSVQGKSGDLFVIPHPSTLKPATVSRCGMIYMEPVRVGWRPLAKSWLQARANLTTAHVDFLMALFDQTIDPCTQFVRKECKEIGPTNDIGLFKSLVNILQTTIGDMPTPPVELTKDVADAVELRLEYRFYFALIWSVGGVLDAASRTRFDQFLRGQMQSQGRRAVFPKDGQVYDFVFKYDFMQYGQRSKSTTETSSDAAAWIRWVDTIEENPVISPQIKFSEITIPTKDTARYNFLMDLLIPNGMPFLFVGPTGRRRSGPTR